MHEIGVIVNNKAKNAASVDPFLAALTKNNMPFQLYRANPEQLDATIKQAIIDHPMLLIGGGDGTIRSAAQQCCHKKTLVGVLPLGTLNHFAKELALPASPEELVQAILKKTTRTIDMAEVNGLVFVNNSSIGVYPRFAKKRDHYMRFYNKWLSYIPGIIQTFKNHENYPLSIKSEELNIFVNTSFLMISNNLYSYEFPLSFQRKDFNQSYLGIYYFKHGKLKLLKMIKLFLNRKDNFAIKKSEIPVEISIKNKERVSISLDGETQTVNTPLIYKSLPNSLTLLTNSS